MKPIDPYREAICRLCEQFPVQRLELFGSATRDDFSDDSDFDFLLTFDEQHDVDYLGVLIALREKLELTVGRSVDLVVAKRFRNPYFQAAVDESRQTIYENSQVVAL